MIFYFSGTGNSFWVAQKLSETFGEQLIPITKAMTEGKEYSLSKGEGLGFVFPVYSWGPPQVVLEFLHNIRLSDTPEYPYFVCTCGDDTGKTDIRYGAITVQCVCHATTIAQNMQ